LIEISDFEFHIPNMKKNSLSLEYSILNVTKTYRLYYNPTGSTSNAGSFSIINPPKKINLNKIRLYYFFTKDKEAF